MTNHSSERGWCSSYFEITDRYSSNRTGTQTKIRRAVLIVVSTIVTLLVIDLKPVQAQSNFSNFGNFGIPTPSQRFLGEGRAQLEQEIRNLQTPLSSQPLLNIDRDAYIQDDLLRLEDPQFHSGNSSLEEIDLPIIPSERTMTGSRRHL